MPFDVPEGSLNFEKGGFSLSSRPPPAGQLTPPSALPLKGSGSAGGYFPKPIKTSGGTGDGWASEAGSRDLGTTVCSPHMNQGIQCRPKLKRLFNGT